MQVEIRVPGALRAKTGGATTVLVEANTVSQALVRLVSAFPVLAPALYGDDGALRPRVNVYVNDVHVRYLQHAETPLRDGDQVYVVPIVMGG
ncbi:MAG: MoaD/ThiS family protein [Anaerolineae bacterium]|nr:MoaD/ThiS family protein [Anaerolineae bacterium]